MTGRVIATYRIRSEPAAIEARAQAIAVEQSVEMPLAAIGSEYVLREIVGQVLEIDEVAPFVFNVSIGLAAATIGDDAGQLLNMAFGNTSLHDDVVLTGLELPAELRVRFGGPQHGIAGLRARTEARGRALTCAAIKPQGLPPEELAMLVERFARGGMDIVKDDHGLADQGYSPFALRVAACSAAARRAAAATGRLTRYVPNLSGSLDDMMAQAALAREDGLDMLLVAPMLVGFANIQALGRAYPDMALLAHPTLGGAARIAPELLIGELFPLIGADAAIFPNYGGRFGYSAETCARIADAARQRGAMPVPAGGMTLERVPEMLDFYSADVMLLIGGSLLAARERLVEETARFADAVAKHPYRPA